MTVLRILLINQLPSTWRLAWWFGGTLVPARPTCWGPCTGYSVRTDAWWWARKLCQGKTGNQLYSSTYAYTYAHLPYRRHPNRLLLSVSFDDSINIWCYILFSFILFFTLALLWIFFFDNFLRYLRFFLLLNCFPSSNPYPNPNPNPHPNTNPVFICTLTLSPSAP